MKPRFMIKYGEEDHLKQLINGKIRFAPSQLYIKLEEAQRNKGQGDVLEGRMKIVAQDARLCNPETGETIWNLTKNTIIISIQDVNEMPVFCLSQYGDEYITEYIDEQNYSIVLPEDKIRSIRSDFHMATHALVIYEPNKFIEDVNNISGHKFACGKIHYYDYNHPPIQMYAYLCNGNENIQENKKFVMTYENRYRHLFCKDVVFSNQDEYRFVELNDLITSAVFYSFNFTSKYQIIPIERLAKPLPISI